MMTRTVLLRALACVAAAACCVVGVSSPSDAADTPVPVPPSPVSRSPELPVLPGHEIMMTATLGACSIVCVSVILFERIDA